jgi:predicted nucleic acid-binding protein
LKTYPDSSFLVSGYLIDGHSPEVHRRLAMRPTVLVTPFHRAEVANAIFQQVFHGRISASEARLACTNFEWDCQTGIWKLASLPEITFDTCIELAGRHTATLGCRTLDSLHVAAALELGAEVFWTFDQRQARLAEAAGLSVS